jgi:hypothetical protein
MTVVDSFGKKIFDLGFFFLFCVLFSPLSDPLGLWKERNGRTALKKKKKKKDRVLGVLLGLKSGPILGWSSRKRVEGRVSIRPASPEKSVLW